MPKIKHIALSTQDVERTARFYVETFGLKEVGKIDDPGTRGVFLTDGDINLAILNFKNDGAAGVERGKGFSGIHHIGFQVESLEEDRAEAHRGGTAPAPRRRGGARHPAGDRGQRRGEVDGPRWRHARRLEDGLAGHALVRPLGRLDRASPPTGSYSANCAARQRSAAPSPSFSRISSNFMPTSVRAA